MHLEINAAYKLHLNILKKIQPMNKTPAIQQFNNLAIQQFNHSPQPRPQPLHLHLQRLIRILQIFQFFKGRTDGIKLFEVNKILNLLL